MVLAVSDSSVLIHLGAIGQLELLPDQFERVLIPPAVWDEVVTHGKSRPVMELIRAAAQKGWLALQTPTNTALIQNLHQHLHAGEAAAIALATETPHDFLLMDETDGREVARRLGLRTKGVIGILLLAKRKRRLTAIHPWLTKLDKSGFHLAPSLISRALREANENQ